MKLASLWVGSSWAVQPPTPLSQAAEKSPGWEKENRGYIHAPPSSTRGLDLLEPAGSSGGRGSRQGHENRRGGPKSATPAPAGSLWVLGGSSLPCGSLLGSCSLATIAAEAGDLPSPSPAQRAPTSARARARSASREEVRRLVPGQPAHGTQAAVAPDSGSATAALESPRDCEGIPWGFDSPDGYKSLATERRPRPRRTRRAEEKRDLLRLRVPQVKALPRPAAPEIKLVAPRCAQRAIRRTRQ